MTALANAAYLKKDALSKMQRLLVRLGHLPLPATLAVLFASVGMILAWVAPPALLAALPGVGGMGGVIARLLLCVIATVTLGGMAWVVARAAERRFLADAPAVEEAPGRGMGVPTPGELPEDGAKAPSTNAEQAGLGLPETTSDPAHQRAWQEAIASRLDPDLHSTPDSAPDSAQDPTPSRLADLWAHGPEVDWTSGSSPPVPPTGPTTERLSTAVHAHSLTAPNAPSPNDIAEPKGGDPQQAPQQAPQQTGPASATGTQQGGPDAMADKRLWPFAPIWASANSILPPVQMGPFIADDSTQSAPQPIGARRPAPVSAKHNRNVLLNRIEQGLARLDRDGATPQFPKPWERTRPRPSARLSREDAASRDEAVGRALRLLGTRATG